MKRAVTTFIAALTMIQSSAYADLMDLPNPGDFADVTQEVPKAPTPPAVTPAPAQSQYAGSVAMTSIPRTSGGTLYRIEKSAAL